MSPRRFGPVRKELATFVELFALSGLLIAQPVLDFLGKNAREMIIFRLSVSDVLVFLLLLLFVPPAVLMAFELLVGAIWPRARRRVHIAVMAVLLGVIAGNYVKVSTHVGAGPRVAASVIVGIAVGFYIVRSSVPQQWLRFLAVAPLIFSVLFVTASPASILLFEDAKAANVTVGHPARVVMIVLDEFPEESLLDGHGHVDAELFPNFAKLAGDSTWYRNETTVAEYTVRAVPAILTGRMPTLSSSLPTSSKYPQSLFTLLGKTYKMNAHEFYEQLCPVAMCGGPRFDNPISAVLDSSSKVMHNLMDLDRSSWDKNLGFRFGLDSLPLGTALPIAKQFLTSLSPSTKPTLDYLHLMLPHQPWRYLGAGKDHGFKNPSIKYLSTYDPRKVVLGREMHLLNVQATDWFLGQAMNKLKAMGEYDNSLIVVTADHGVAFPYRRNTIQADYDNIMWIPLFIKAPAQTIGRVDDRPMLSIDVLPTMADILGVKIPWKVDGRSALGPPRPPGPVTIIHSDIGFVGRKQTFLGPAGFAKVLRSRAAPAGGDPALRIYRSGLYGRLIGRLAAPLVNPAGSRPRSGTLYTPGGWNDVDPDSDHVPWTTATGTVTGVKAGTVAIAVNGRVAGLAHITDGGLYYAMLAPTMFRAGKNDVTAYLVLGLPRSPRLVAIAPESPDGRVRTP